MNVPANLFMWIMACLPIIVLLVLMIKFQWGATEAAPVGLFITIFTGVVFYKANIKLLAAESAKGIWSALSVLLIVWTAILMYQVADEAKAFLVIRNGMKKLLPNELLLVLAMGWIFVSFLQGITGFGVPVAVGAPLLMGIGVLPMWAVIIPLLGQSWGNTFGTLAAAWDALSMSTGMAPGSAEYLKTALWAALFLWAWNMMIGIVICWFYGKGRALKKGLPAVLIMSVIQGGGEVLFSQINTTLACFLPTCMALAALLLMNRTKRYKGNWSIKDSPIMNRCFGGGSLEETPPDMTLLQAFVPYIVLTVITVTVLVVTPVKHLLGQISFGLSFPETSTGYGFVNQAEPCFSPISPFTHASMFLFLSSLAGLVYFGKKGWIRSGGPRRVFVKSITMAVPSGIALIGLIIMSKIMGGTGQTMVLAHGIASILGKGYAVLALVVGMTGSFMTGSNMTSNILFGDFQRTTAGLLHLDFSIILAAQTAGGSIGSAISPSSIILGTTTAGILGYEGRILKKILPIVLTVALVLGIIVFLKAAF